MKEEIKVLVTYRLERAKESLDEAELLLREGHTNTYVNRLYYACFYAVSALLVMNGLSSSKHSGVRSLFHKNFVRTGKVNQEFGKLYNKLFNRRQKGDYSDLIRFEKDEVDEWYKDAKAFVEAIEKIIKKEMKH